MIKIFNRLAVVTNFEHPLFLILMMMGLVSILAGFIMIKFPPKKINSLYGYRTLNSMRSQERWDYAQSYSAKEMIRAGIVLTLLSVVGLMNVMGPFIGMITGVALMIVSFISVSIRTEKAINLKFGKE